MLTRRLVRTVLTECLARIVRTLHIVPAVSLGRIVLTRSLVSTVLTRSLVRTVLTVSSLGVVLRGLGGAAKRLRVLRRDLRVRILSALSFLSGPVVDLQPGRNACLCVIALVHFSSSC